MVGQERGLLVRCMWPVADAQLTPRTLPNLPHKSCQIIYAPVYGVTRYLAVYHQRDPTLKLFSVHLAQSFDLLRWEFLRRLVTNADMPVLAVDKGTGQVLLAYEKFHSTARLW